MPCEVESPVKGKGRKELEAYINGLNEFVGKMKREGQILSTEKEEERRTQIDEQRESRVALEKNVDFEEVTSSFLVGRKEEQLWGKNEIAASVNFHIREPHSCLGMDDFQSTDAGIQREIKKSDQRLTENLRKLKLAVPREFRPDGDAPQVGSDRSIDKIAPQTRARSNGSTPRIFLKTAIGRLVENNTPVLFQGFDESKTRKKKVLDKEFLRFNHPYCKLLFENDDQINKQSVRNVYVSYKEPESQSPTQKPTKGFSTLGRTKSLSTKQQSLKVKITKRATMREQKVARDTEPGGFEKRVKFASAKRSSRRTSQPGLAVRNLASAAGAVIGRPGYLKG